jgi:hypothetical protein
MAIYSFTLAVVGGERNPFIFELTIPNDNYEVSLPLCNDVRHAFANTMIYNHNFKYNFEINWGEYGAEDYEIIWITSLDEGTHIYKKAGTYTVKINGLFERMGCKITTKFSKNINKN